MIPCPRCIGGKLEWTRPYSQYSGAWVCVNCGHSPEHRQVPAWVARSAPKHGPRLISGSGKA